jgi:hypothetical protein
MYKATLTFSLLFLAVVGSAQIPPQNNGGADTSAQPPSNISSTSASQVYPSDIPIPTPTTSDGDPSQTNKTGPSDCYHHNRTHSAIPTDQPLPSGVFPSAASGASSVSKPHFSCKPDSGSTIPTGTASVPPYGAGALPSTNVSIPIHSGAAPTGTDHHDGNFTLPTGSPIPSSSGLDQQDPPVAVATTTYGKLYCLSINHLIILYILIALPIDFLVGRRRLVRRQF